jgi:hypothetical protein
VIIENAGLKGLKSDLAHLDSVSTKIGFIRWQWEYYRATYDLKLENKATGDEYFLRFNARAVEGKLESPYTILVLEDTYIGRGTFPHGLDYESPVPDQILKTASTKLAELKKQLSE